MTMRKGFLGAALMLLGAGVACVASRVQVTWDGSAHAASPTPPTTTMQPTLPPPSPAQVADARAISRTFVQVAEQLKPSVVSIVVEKKGGAGSARGMRRGGGHHGGTPFNPFEGTPFAPFFGGGEVTSRNSRCPSRWAPGRAWSSTRRD